MNAIPILVKTRQLASIKWLIMSVFACRDGKERIVKFLRNIRLIVPRQSVSMMEYAKKMSMEKRLVFVSTDSPDLVVENTREILVPSISVETKQFALLLMTSALLPANARKASLVRIVRE